MKGKLAKIMLGAAVIAEASDFSYSGEVREAIEVPETFDSEHIEKFGGTPKGGDLEINGLLKKGDSGAAAVQAAFDANTESADLKLYIDATSYYELDATKTPASIAIVTKAPTAITAEAAGVIKVSYSFSISGALKYVAGV